MSFILFADDTAAYVQHDSIEGAIQILNSELPKVAAWFDSNKLTLNLNKNQMLIPPRKKNLNIKGEVILLNESIQRVTNSRFLDVILDQQISNIFYLNNHFFFNWKDHISMELQNNSKSCVIISRNRNTLDIKSKKTYLF